MKDVGLTWVEAEKLALKKQLTSVFGPVFLYAEVMVEGGGSLYWERCENEYYIKQLVNLQYNYSGRNLQLFYLLNFIIF